MTTTDPTTARLTTALRAFPGVLFPYLPTPGRVGALALAIATIAATGIAWWGNTAGSAGAVVGVFLAVVLTGFTVAAAVLPRVAYAWLERKGWPAGSEPEIPVIGAHIPLAAFTIPNVMLASDHPAYAAMGAVGAVGAALWVLHEALSAKKTYDDARH